MVVGNQAKNHIIGVLLNAVTDDMIRQFSGHLWLTERRVIDKNEHLFYFGVGLGAIWAAS